MINTIKVQSVYKPKRKPNLVRWMTKHNVSTFVTSSDIAVTRAIEAQTKQDDYERNI